MLFRSRGITSVEDNIQENYHLETPVGQFFSAFRNDLLKHLTKDRVPTIGSGSTDESMNDVMVDQEREKELREFMQEMERSKNRCR